MTKILVIDDEPSIINLVSAYLKPEGYEVYTAADGNAGLKAARAFKPDLIILDLMLPGMDGIELLSRLRRESDVYVIMLTARTDETDKIVGLSVGADDYVTKPFSLRELLARVKAHLRREETATPAEETPDKFVIGTVTVDCKRHEILKAGHPLELTNREFCLLEYFIRHPNELITRARLLDEVWGYDSSPTTRTVDSHVLRLRRHIEPDPENPCYIKTVHGAGYLFENES